MKAYLVTTGTIFGLIGTMHLSMLISQARSVTLDAGFVAENGGLGALCVALAAWAFLLARSLRARVA